MPFLLGFEHLTNYFTRNTNKICFVSLIKICRESRLKMWCSFKFQLRGWLNWPITGRVMIRCFVQFCLRRRQKERGICIWITINVGLFSAHCDCWLLTQTLYVLRGVFFSSFISVVLAIAIFGHKPEKMTKSRQPNCLNATQTMQAHFFFWLANTN